jgi:hypothetical protein
MFRREMSEGKYVIHIGNNNNNLKYNTSVDRKRGVGLQYWFSIFRRDEGGGEGGGGVIDKVTIMAI